MPSITIWGDIACPWTSLALIRLHEARDRTGLNGDVEFDLRAWPLELVNRRPTPKLTLDAEVAVIASHEPGLGWRPWHRPDSQYAVSSLLALEAVQAARDPSIGGVRASDQLDLALRHALFADSRCITLHSTVMDVAAGCDRVNAAALAAALERGTARHTVFEQWRQSSDAGVEGSPHVFLPDGTDIHNPGLTIHWTDEHGSGYPVIDDDDPGVYERLLRQAAGERLSTRGEG